MVLSAGGGSCAGGCSGAFAGDGDEEEEDAGCDDSSAVAFGGLENASAADAVPSAGLPKKSEAFVMTETPLTSRFEKATWSGTKATGGGGEESALAASGTVIAGLLAAGSCLAGLVTAVGVGAGLEKAAEASPAGLEKSAVADPLPDPTAGEARAGGVANLDAATGAGVLIATAGGGCAKGDA